MRKLILLALVTAACTPRPKAPTKPTEYVCEGYSLMRDGSEVKASDGNLVGRLSWRDSTGEHFVAWPTTPTDREAIEIVIPSDPRQDAMHRIYDTTFGSSTADWRLKSRQTCTARDGYSDILTRYIKGETLDDLTTSLALDSNDETRVLLRRAMASLNHRYWRDGH
ncbi:MAG TPA: hypothetical protein VMZ53_29010 [Kofleriaceae bacterium]|nr:hypothetical protein [Kofleriaceae bacterium]